MIIIDDYWKLINRHRLILLKQKATLKLHIVRISVSTAAKHSGKSKPLWLENINKKNR